MDIRPINDTNTLQLAVPSLQVKRIATKVVKDPNGLIPPTVFKILKWERIRLRIMFGMTLAILLASIVMIMVYAIHFHAYWPTYILPTVVGLFAFWKCANTVNEYQSMQRSIAKYEEDLRVNMASMPTFIPRLYLALHKKQVTHNWFTFTFIFYGGIVTILLWLLKGVHWWIFEFDKWVHTLFANPDLMAWLFTGALVLVVLAHVLFAIQRKKRIMDIDSYFGEQVVQGGTIEESKVALNRFYRRLFIISLLVLLVIPLLVRLVLKIIHRRK